MGTSTAVPARRTRRRAAGVLVAGAATLTLGLTACTGSDSDGYAQSTERTPLQVVNASFEKSSQAQSGKFAMSVEFSGEGEGESGNVQAEGAFDGAAEAVEMRMTVDAPGAEGLAPVLRIVGGQLYVSGVPGVEPQQWMQVPLEHADAMGMDTSQLDPTAQLEQLRAVSEDVEEIGTATVRGVEAHGYAGVIDMQKALEIATSPEEKAEAQEALDEAGLQKVPFELYVDSEDRPVRMVVSMDVAEGEQKASAKVRVDYFDWGTPVSIAAPAPDSVVQAPAGLHEGADTPAA
ncbi:hypothetical protein CLV92_107211 [Kineococcus xinjiangensis]|uniref:Lipoprotein LprG n=1 Tax=Kineococcus xinjiangensis TaxID=512762 RepID=A0A2S6IKH8_9ACTN|nr:DUF6612 family protein [Kineococcus xinjiangensis]PPK94708.1 hypothetical protein CLV92_107211 [Kineococcus xinjiangensis]